MFEAKTFCGKAFGFKNKLLEKRFSYLSKIVFKRIVLVTKKVKNKSKMFLKKSKIRAKFQVVAYNFCKQFRYKTNFKKNINQFNKKLKKSVDKLTLLYYHY